MKYLKYFTFLTQEEIEELADKVKTQPEKREAQRRLAEEVTEFVHGKPAVVEAEHISAALFSGDVAKLTSSEIEQGFKNMPTVEVSSENKTLLSGWLMLHLLNHLVVKLVRISLTGLLESMVIR
ncbi:tyrosyl-tRNA synthetase [Lentilactobacillus kosonis]|uniref:Tyrosyl-tRNA synthetase n=1 Tax=Lentilactobacillus kosonis TaxID=2810561 RepID=A0A401FNH8_9LACO|nr:tyrosyl-tRNA synthetase [Lentilactobacillus kosonis]